MEDYSDRITKLRDESDERVREMIDAFCARNGEQAVDPLVKMVNMVDDVWGLWLIAFAFADNAQRREASLTLTIRLIKTVIALTLDAATPADASEEDRKRELAYLDSLVKLRLADATDAIRGR
jgi:cytochrome P450